MTAALGAVGLADVVRYSGASGDRNPIHYDPDFAHAAGYDRLFAMGALHGAWLISHALTQGAVLPDSGPAAVRLRFRGIVDLGASLAADVVPVENGHEATLSVAGRVCATARIERLTVPPTTSAGADEQATRFPVELGAARAFAASVRWPWPIEENSVVPPTYATVLSFWLPQADPIARVGFDPGRTLLGEMSVEFVDGPIRVGEVFEVREYVTNERMRSGSAGELRLADVVAELSDESGLRVRYCNTFILTPDPSEAAPPKKEVVLRGSRDPRSGESYYPERALSVDGSLRELEPVDLARHGRLYTWTTFDGRHFGQIDLDDSVRLQVRLGPGPHEIGAPYVLARGGDADWWFARA